MRSYVPRALLTAAIAVTAAACAAAGAGSDLGGEAGGRYQVLVPDLVATGATQDAADQTSEALRRLMTTMATHTSVSERALNQAMEQYEIEQLSEITARQLAQQVNVELVMWGTLASAGSGLQADVKFVDVRSGDEIVLEDVSGATPEALAQAIFTQFEQSVEGIRQAAFCNDYLSSQQFERALETCEAALAIVPRSTTALYGKATALLELDRGEEALAVYDELLEIDPAHENALLGAGLAASQLGRENAMDYYTRFLEINPGNVQVRMTIANDIAQTGDYISAFRVLETAIAENQDNVEFQQYLFSIATAAGNRAQELEDEAQAQELFQAALAAYEIGYADATNLDASTLRNVIAVNNALGRTEQAIQVAQQATMQFDTVASIWSQYATVLQDSERYAEAAEALTRVIELDPDYTDAYVRRALAYMESGQTQAARADLDVAASKGNRANVATIFFSMGGEALSSNNFAEAAELLSTAHSYAEGDRKSEISFYWGYALYKQGESIAKANVQGNVADARRALALFERALPLVNASNNPQAATVADAARQYIANQQAIISAGGE
ncbi:MAG TPA: tetratricopeptide repeat protein [Longimicrobiaceae bacterium]|nr:tetratricopeptide repeat protein [Longimicrobiaceae bacterium]